MSRAFVKEPEGDAILPEIPERAHSPHENFVTPSGLRRLQAHAEGLRARRKALAGGPSGETRRERLILDRDLRYIEERIRRAVVIDPAGQPKDEVRFGATVEVETPDGRRLTFEIVGEDEADPAQGRISWVSPLARALDEARIGDAVAWKRPGGEVALTVVAIR